MFIRTERLFLRPAWAEDAPELTRAIGQEPVVRMLARVPWPYAEEHARQWIEAPRPTSHPDLLVTLPEAGGRIIGACGLHEADGCTQVGYWIEPEHWNRGYATEALGACSRWPARLAIAASSAATPRTIRPRAGCCASPASARWAAHGRSTALAVRPSWKGLNTRWSWET